ncbi:MAG: low affinity iron permease family protein [Verrucomicrobiota bacterium]
MKENSNPEILNAGTNPKGKNSERFRKFATKTSAIVGSPWSFLSAVLIILIWAALGPIFHFADTWQLVINTATTIVTFLMVFLIQNTQNRDAKAIHLKLDELIHAVKGARNQLIDLENLSEEEMVKLQTEFTEARKRARIERCEEKEDCDE